MKKLLIILLLGIHMFNMGGYSVLFEFLIRQNNTLLIQKLDEHEYNESTLIELKIHLPLPYNANWPEYERIDGQVQHNGIQYNYVKRKVWNDTLYVLCLPNSGMMKLTAAKSQYAHNAGDVPADHSRSPFAKRDNVNATCNTLPSLLSRTISDDRNTHTYYLFDSPLFASVVDSPDQPPEIPVIFHFAIPVTAINS